MVTWSPVQTAAKSKGTLVYAMSQTWTGVLTQPRPWGSAFDGFCIGLAAHWMQLAYSGRDYPYNKATQEYYGTSWEATRDQNLSDSTKAASWVDFWTSALSPYGMTASKTLHAQYAHPPTGVFLATVASKAYGCYGVTFTRAAGAHAIALCHAQGRRFHLFDGNYGHLAITGDPCQWSDFLNWYFAQTSYAGRYQTNAITGVRPGKA